MASPAYAVGDEVPLGRFVRTLLHQLVQELLKSGPEFPALAEGQRLHPAQLVELPRAATARLTAGAATPNIYLF
jgi:hypothetical protein